MLVNEVMLKDVLTVQPTTTLTTLLKLFKDFHTFPLVPVVEENNRLVGIVDLRDLLKISQPYNSVSGDLLRTLISPEEEKDTLQNLAFIRSDKLILVKDIMETSFFVVEEDLSLEKAYSLMKLNQKEKVPVVRKGYLVGILTLTDLVFGFFKEKGMI
ncbi:MAG TPA: hypothetical protein DHV62_07940 [Elusimicrobia bacterium]|jgi:CBS domain-containing protein|nr:hypothetical protein [Elusimicrobiota bacterium]